MNQKLITLAVSGAVVLVAVGSVYAALLTQQRPNIKIVEPEQNSAVTSNDTKNSTDAVTNKQAAETQQEQTNPTQNNSVSSDPKEEQIASNTLAANPIVKQVVGNAKTVDDLASTTCTKLNELPIKVESISVELLKPTFGEKSASYLTLLKQVAKYCTDGKIDDKEKSSLADLATNLGINATDIGL